MKDEKDNWDKTAIVAQIVASILVPLAIAYIGWLYTSSTKEVEIATSNYNLKISEINSKVEQARLVMEYTDLLTSKDENKRKLAIASIKMALPEKGPILISQVSITDKSEEIKEFARKAIGTVKDKTFQYSSPKCDIKNSLIFCSLQIAALEQDQTLNIATKKAVLKSGGPQIIESVISKSITVQPSSAEESPESFYLVAGISYELLIEFSNTFNKTQTNNYGLQTATLTFNFADKDITFTNPFNVDSKVTLSAGGAGAFNPFLLLFVTFFVVRKFYLKGSLKISGSLKRLL